MKKILFLILAIALFYCCGRSDAIDEFEEELAEINPDVPVYCQSI